uniref:Small ribosomal subunit protein uS8 n=1 Tax=uncultured Microgenomates bacterium Rifle_16ft_4_minimus_5036 TaxID=1665119 RepID=A0A0H4T909_9BACT|nr:30S ribosomal protein S8, small subunit ribosomal protein S8 [uncultured Microgenomates bacterium Rifle_16ft_4_minimus_5036]
MAKTKKELKGSSTGKTNYPVGDFLIRIKNAAMANNREVEAHDSKFLAAVAETLKKERYVESYERVDGKILLRLSYHNKAPILMNVELVSKPGLRIYMNSDELEKARGPELYILSTPKGVMSSREARKIRIGGEVIAKVY